MPNEQTRLESLDKTAALALLTELLTELFEIPPGKITMDADLYQDLDIDSIDAVDLSIAFKKRTGRQLTPEEFRKVRTIGDAIAVFCAPAAKDAAAPTQSASA
ncbi:MAG: phosphopantetheine-binding protein [Zoogloeaceae bacterium]|nr:phosphopantetheine-binding protein [Zoogloeaceae bacterium]